MTKKKVMKKKTVSMKKPKVTPVRKTITPHVFRPRESNTERILIENFVSLQKVMVNLSVKFDNLSHQISRLLDLFEISAKTLVEKGVDMKVDNQEVIKRMDNLSEQNKLMARGLALMHESGVGQDSPPLPMQKVQTPQIPKQKRVVEPNQNIGEQQRIAESNQNPETYQKSPLSKFKPLPKD